MIFVSFNISLDGCKEDSLYSVSKVQINTTKIVTVSKNALPEVLICAVYHSEVWQVSCNTT